MLHQYIIGVTLTLTISELFLSNQFLVIIYDVDGDFLVITFHFWSKVKYFPTSDMKYKVTIRLLVGGYYNITMDSISVYVFTI